MTAPETGHQQVSGPVLRPDTQEKQGGDCPLPSSQPISPPTEEGRCGAFLSDTSGALRHTQRSPLCPLAPETLPAFSIRHGPSPWGQKPPSLTRFWSQKSPAWMARPDHRTLVRLTSGPLATQVYSALKHGHHGSRRHGASLNTGSQEDVSVPRAASWGHSRLTTRLLAIPGGTRASRLSPGTSSLHCVQLGGSTALPSTPASNSAFHHQRPRSVTQRLSPAKTPRTGGVGALPGSDSRDCIRIKFPLFKHTRGSPGKTLPVNPG